MKILLKNIHIIFVVNLIFIHQIYSQDNQYSNEERVYEIARKHEEIRNLLDEFPNLRLDAHYSEEYEIWVIELLYGDWGEIGLITVSTETNEILEFNADIEQLEVWKNYPENSSDEGLNHQWFDFMTIFLPHFEGATLAWFSFIIVLMLVANPNKIISIQNLHLLFLYMLCPFLLLHWVNLKIAYSGIFLLTFLLFLYCIFRSCKITSNSLNLNINSTYLIGFIVFITLLLHLQTVYQKGIGDAGIWSSIGAEYIQETGNLPYGNEFGANCIYGPLMYISFIPANLFFEPQVEINQNHVEFVQYQAFEMRGVQSTVLFFDCITFLAIFLLYKRWGSIRAGLVVMIIYGLSPYMLGIISEMGIERASHVVGTPLILFSVFFLHKPMLSGLLLGWACGMVYYPIFLFPLIARTIHQQYGIKKAALFFFGFAMVGVLCLIMILTLVHPIAENTNALIAFLDDTVLQQQFKEGYGTSELSFWGQYPILAQWGKPLIGLMYMLFCFALFFIPRLNEQQLYYLISAVLIGTQLVLSFGGGTYIGFYLAPLTIALFPTFNTEKKNEINDC